MRILLQEMVLNLPYAVKAESVREFDLIECIVEELLFGPFIPRTRELVFIEDAELHWMAPLSRWLPGEIDDQAVVGASGDHNENMPDFVVSEHIRPRIGVARAHDEGADGEGEEASQEPDSLAKSKRINEPRREHRHDAAKAKEESVDRAGRRMKRRPFENDADSCSDPCGNDQPDRRPTVECQVTLSASPS